MRLGPQRLICLNAWTPVSGTYGEVFGVALCGGVSLEVGFEVSKAHARPSLPLFVCLSDSLCLSLSLLLLPSPSSGLYGLHVSSQHGACLPIATLPTMITDSFSETVSKPPVRCFFYKLCWSQCLFTEVEQ